MARTRNTPVSKPTDAMRVAAYLRVSTEDQAASGLGLAAQQSRCKAMATVKGWPEPTIYADEGISGAKDASKRPALKRLLDDVQAQRLDAVIILSLDRLGRKTRLVLDLVDEMREHGVSLVSCKESLDTTTAQGQFVLTMFAALAELERGLTAERTVAALAERNKLDGNVGRLPYGYIRTPEGVAINPLAHEVVLRIFKLRKRGLSLRDIAADLNAAGYRTPYSDAQWYHTSVREVLLNEDAYRGGNRGASSLKWPVILPSLRSGR